MSLRFFLSSSSHNFLVATSICAIRSLSRSASEALTKQATGPAKVKARLKVTLFTWGFILWNRLVFLTVRWRKLPSSSS